MIAKNTAMHGIKDAQSAGLFDWIPVCAGMTEYVPNVMGYAQNIG